MSETNSAKIQGPSLNPPEDDETPRNGLRCRYDSYGRLLGFELPDDETYDDRLYCFDK